MRSYRAAFFPYGISILFYDKASGLIQINKTRVAISYVIVIVLNCRPPTRCISCAVVLSMIRALHHRSPTGVHSCHAGPAAARHCTIRRSTCCVGRLYYCLPDVRLHLCSKWLMYRVFKYAGLSRNRACVATASYQRVVRIAIATMRTAPSSCRNMLQMKSSGMRFVTVSAMSTAHGPMRPAPHRHHSALRHDRISMRTFQSQTLGSGHQRSTSAMHRQSGSRNSREAGLKITYIAVIQTVCACHSSSLPGSRFSSAKVHAVQKNGLNVAGPDEFGNLPCDERAF